MLFLIRKKIHFKINNFGLKPMHELKILTYRKKELNIYSFCTRKSAFVIELLQFPMTVTFQLPKLQGNDYFLTVKECLSFSIIISDLSISSEVTITRMSASLFLSISMICGKFLLTLWCLTMLVPKGVIISTYIAISPEQNTFKKFMFTEF